MVTNLNIYSTTLIEYIAFNTMELKEATTCLNFIYTIWRGKRILIVYDNLSKHIITFFGNLDYQFVDISRLEALVSKFLNSKN